jgi:hypothetical protein
MSTKYFSGNHFIKKNNTGIGLQLIEILLTFAADFDG